MGLSICLCQDTHKRNSEIKIGLRFVQKYSFYNPHAYFQTFLKI